jgi:hypothetical protein
MTTQEIEAAVLRFCHSKAHGKRIVGMRNAKGTLRCVVRYLDSLSSSYNSDGTINAKVVLFAGDSWEDVLNQIENSGKNS